MSDPKARYWHLLDDGRMQCDLCPRDCRLHEGQRGACFVRARENDRMVLTTYGRSSGFCIDPVEKKPLNHFYPGSSILSFGTAGCNLACKFCQNWDISKSRDVDTLADSASPEQLARAALEHGCRSVAFTYNDPVIFAEYAMDVAENARAAAFEDARFKPLTPEEFGHTDIEVSLLSTPKRLPFEHHAELIARLRPGVDGIILEQSEEGKRATFLPQVWEGLPDPEQFIAHLRQKAGIAQNTDIRLCRVKRYTVLKWREAELRQ